MTIVTVVTIKLTAGAVSKIPSQSSQPSRGVQRERLVSPVGSVGAFAYGKGRHRRPAPPKGARALLLGTDKSAFVLLSRKVTKAKLLKGGFLLGER